MAMNPFQFALLDHEIAYQVHIYRCSPLKHSIHADADICVFVRDPAKTYKRLIKDADLPNVKKVIGVTKLRTEWGQFEARRKLLNSYDVFMCDDAISLVLTRFLGKQFITSKKFPVGVKMGPGHNVGTQILKMRDSVPFYLTAGTVQSIPIGRTSFTASQVTENLQSALALIVSHIPNKWLNVRQISVRTANSVALPIYTAVPTRPAQLKAAALKEKAEKQALKQEKFAAMTADAAATKAAAATSKAAVTAVAPKAAAPKTTAPVAVAATPAKSPAKKEASPAKKTPSKEDKPAAVTPKDQKSKKRESSGEKLDSPSPKKAKIAEAPATKSPAPKAKTPTKATPDKKKLTPKK
jgi:ribosome biogenesis protein UTP30